MRNFAEFLEQARPEIDRLALELKEYYHPNEMKCPANMHFHTVVESFYANGKHYDTNSFNTPITDMQGIIQDALHYRWTISFDKETKVFKFEKHFPNGMYRIATYTPYDKDALDMSVHE